MNRLFEIEPIVAKGAVITHDTQSQLTYQLLFLDEDGDSQNSLFTVYHRNPKQRPIIILSDNGELHVRKMNLTDADADFYSDYYANLFLDAFYAWRTPFLDDFEELNRKNRE